MTSEDLTGCYAINTEGAWSPVADGTKLNPFRLYMAIRNRDDSPVKVEQNAQSRIKFVYWARMRWKQKSKAWKGKTEIRKMLPLT